MKVGYIAMFALTALAGILSGIAWLVPNGLMAGALGMSLAAGAIRLGRLQQRQQGKLGRDQILLTGMVSGLVAGVLMAAISQACAGSRLEGEAAFFGPPGLPYWAPLVMGVLYGVVVQWGYAARISSPRPLWAAVFSTCLGCFLLKAFATALYFCLVEKMVKSDLQGILFGSAMLSLFGAVPFALFWVLSMAWTDPAWSLRPAPGDQCAAPSVLERQNE